MSEQAVYNLTPRGRAMVLVTVVLGTTIYTATMLISSALLPQLQGALGATQDEVSWVMTFNIVATAVATPTTGFLADYFGARRTMVWCAAGFTVATFMCGAAGSLEELIVWRIVQGAAGAPLVPLGQTLLFNAYPKAQHGLIISIYGMANMLGPSAAPVLAGEIAEWYGWRWGFWMVVPVAFVTMIGYLAVLPRDAPGQRPKLDWIGFLSLSVALAAGQLVLSRGQRLDWFESTEIVVATFLTALALYLFIAHSLTAARPFIRLGLLRDRNYAVGLVLVTLFGMLNFAPVVLLPPLLQNHAGYTDSAIGEFVAWRGVGTAFGFFAAMLMSRVDPRVTMITGALIQAASGVWLMSFNLNVDMVTLCANSALQGASVGLAWAPMTVVTFSTLRPEYRAEGMSMFHLLRTFGSSLFISVAVAEVVRATGANYARLGEHLSAHNRVLDLPWAMGSWTAETLPGLARLSNEINRQATMIGYTNAFLLFTLVSAAAIPLCLLTRAPGRKG